MARIRTIKPEFWADEKLAPMEPIHRLVFLGLISMADDQGRLVDNIKAIDGSLFSETNDTARESLEVLSRASRITRFVGASGQRVIQINNWDKHQKVNHPKRALLPAPPEPGETEGVAGNDLTKKRRENRKKSTREPQEDGAPLPTTNDLRPSAGRRDESTRTPVAIAGDLWKARRGEPSYPRIGKALKPLLAARGAKQVLTVWEGYLLDREGKSFATPEDFAQNYELYRKKWGQVMGEDGCTWEPMPDEPEAAA